jgi:lysyl-tRNA synthetase class I
MQALKAEKAPDPSGQFYRELAGLKVSLNELNRRVAAQAKEKEVQTVAGRPRRQLAEAQMKQIMAALSDENLRLIENAFQAASEQQQRQLQESLTNFARYLDQIRAEDTELVLASIEEMDRKSEVKFRETEQVIDALLESVQTAPQR